MNHLRILMGARLTGLRNRLSGHTLAWWAGLVALFAVLIGSLLALGNAAAPGLLKPPADVVTAVGMADGKRTLPAGSAALEAAFWLAALASSVLNFRVMELLFRRKDIRAVEHLPIRLYALYVDRLLAALGEALAAALVLAPFFLPLVWHGGGLAAATSIALIGLGLVTSSAIGFAVQLSAGASMAGDVTRAKKDAAKKSGKPSRSRDIYGGSGQIFVYSPGVALAVSVIIILFAKLAMGEVLKAGEATRAFGVGLGILAVAFGVALVVSLRHFVRAFPRMTARFHEVDFVGYDISAQHQKSHFGSKQFGEALLPAGARAAFRAYALQFGRRYLLARWSYLFGWLAGAVAIFRLSEAAFPAWLVVTLPAIAAATLVNPWLRLSSPRIRPAYQNLLALPAGADTAAAIVFAVRELLLFAGPYAVIVVLARGVRHADWAGGAALAALAFGACLALNGAMAIAWRLLGRSRIAEIFVPVLLAIGMVALANVSLWALAVAVVVLAFGHVAAMSRPNTSRAQTQ